MAKSSIRLSINKNFPKASNHSQGLSSTTFIFKDLQGLELHLLNSNTFKDFQRPRGTLRAIVRLD